MRIEYCIFASQFFGHNFWTRPRDIAVTRKYQTGLAQKPLPVFKASCVKTYANCACQRLMRYLKSYIADFPMRTKSRLGMRCPVGLPSHTYCIFSPQLTTRQSLSPRHRFSLPLHCAPISTAGLMRSLRKRPGIAPSESSRFTARTLRRPRRESKHSRGLRNVSTDGSPQSKVSLPDLGRR